MKFKPQHVGFTILIALLIIPIFGHLNTMPLRGYDEARLAVNAAEMASNGDYIVTYFNGEPDMWNTKPPLMIWLQVVFIKTMGLNELAVRLPSAIAAFITCMALLWFSVKYLNSFWLGFITIMVLMTSQGYVSIHGTRTGDYDALLTLFTTLYCLSFFIYTESKNAKYFYLTCIFIALAGLTKGVAGMIFLPALFIYAVISKSFTHLLKNKHTYFALLIPVLIIGGYYLLRENQNPGYLEAVADNELGGRFNTPKEGHYGNLYYYIESIIYNNFTHWHLLLPCGFLLAIFHRKDVIRKLGIYTGLLVVLYHWAINSAATKLWWYEIPMYPFMAILVALFVYHIFKITVSWKPLQEKIRFNIIPALFLFLVFIRPFGDTWDNTYWPQEDESEKETYAIGYTLKDAIDNRINLDGYKLLNPGYNANWLFYTYALQEKGQDLEFGNIENLQVGDKIVLNQLDLLSEVRENYALNAISVDEKRNIYFYEITGFKQHQ